LNKIVKIQGSSVKFDNFFARVKKIPVGMLTRKNVDNTDVENNKLERLTSYTDIKRRIL
jgi:hypothetical protein